MLLYICIYLYSRRCRRRRRFKCIWNGWRNANARVRRPKTENITITSNTSTPRIECEAWILFQFYFYDCIWANAWFIDSWLNRDSQDGSSSIWKIWSCDRNFRAKWLDLENGISQKWDNKCAWLLEMVCTALRFKSVCIYGNPSCGGCVGILRRAQELRNGNEK